MTWFVYLLLCADNTLYCGITNDIQNRLKAHNDGKGAKYTRSRRPVKVVYAERAKNKSSALKREHAIKKLSRPQKERLIGPSRWDASMYDAKKNCKHKVKDQWSGVKCSKCGGWFCY